MILSAPDRLSIQNDAFALVGDPHTLHLHLYPHSLSPSSSRSPHFLSLFIQIPTLSLPLYLDPHTLSPSSSRYPISLCLHLDPHSLSYSRSPLLSLPLYPRSSLSKSPLILSLNPNLYLSLNPNLYISLNAYQYLSLNAYLYLSLNPNQYLPLNPYLYLALNPNLYLSLNFYQYLPLNPYLYLSLNPNQYLPLNLQARAGLTSCVSFLSLCKSYGALETNYTVWSDLNTNLGRLGTLLTYSTDQEATVAIYRSFVIKSMSAVSERLGFSPKPNEGIFY